MVEVDKEIIDAEVVEDNGQEEKQLTND